MMPVAFYIVNKSDLNPNILEHPWCICELRTETADTIIFEPKTGFIASFGMTLAENKISYRLKFKNNASLMSLSKKYDNQCRLTAAGKTLNREILELPMMQLYQKKRYTN